MWEVRGHSCVSPFFSYHVGPSIELDLLAGQQSPLSNDTSHWPNYFLFFKMWSHVFKSGLELMMVPRR